MEIQLWHLIVAGTTVLASLFTAFGVYHGVVLKPETARRKDVESRLTEIEKEQALTKQRLEHGEEKFDEILEAIKELRTEMKEQFAGLDNRLRHVEQAVFNGHPTK